MIEHEYYCESCYLQSSSIHSIPHFANFKDIKCWGHSVEFDFAKDKRIRGKLFELRSKSQTLIDQRNQLHSKLLDFEPHAHLAGASESKTIEFEIAQIDLKIEKLEGVTIPRLRKKLVSLLSKRQEIQDVEEGRRNFENKVIARELEEEQFANTLYRVRPSEHTKYFKEELDKLFDLDFETLRSEKSNQKLQQAIYCDRCSRGVSIDGDDPNLRVSRHVSAGIDQLTGTLDCAYSSIGLTEVDLDWITYARLSDDEFRNIKDGRPLDWPRIQGRAITLEERRLMQEELLRRSLERRNGG